MVGAGVAPLGVDLLMLLAWSLTLDLASTIDEDETVDLERVKHTADFGALLARRVAGKDMIVGSSDEANVGESGSRETGVEVKQVVFFNRLELNRVTHVASARFGRQCQIWCLPKVRYPL